MNCKHHLLLKGFLLLLAICFIQLGIMSVKKDIIASSSGPQPGKVFAKPHIETFLYTNRLSCSLEDAVLTRQHVPQNELEDIVKRRAEEYRQHQIRMEADIASLILAPANSPLQYPITGFTISPLKKSIVPGLALHAQQRKVYKVSLSVMSGVLSVEDVQDEQVEGQGQSELIISSSNLTQLNDLLSRVSYTSTVYHIKTSDLEFFMDGLGQLLVASCERFTIGHQGHRFEKKYSHYRTQTDADKRKKLSHHFFKNYLKYVKF
ncbi:uncharacterized protein b4galnt2.2 isoform X5 [Danio rerio]